MSAKRVSHLTALLRFDREMLKGCPEGACLVGVDEVGRGSLIGPVVAAAVCLPEKLTAPQRKALQFLNDSKKLTPQLRATLAAVIHETCQVGIGVAEKAEVDQLNVHHASLLAAYRAYQAVFSSSGDERAYLLLDGRALLPDFPKPRQQAVVKGDGKSAAIAAASVVAKHYRDQWVIRLAQEYPGYQWEQNMGYGTPAHLEAIERLGLTPHHRVRFRLVQEQLSLQL